MRQGPSLGASARKNAGNADRERADDREMPWQQRIVGGCDPDRDDQEGREDGLRDEELGDALDVPEDLTTLGDHAGHSGEVAVHEDDIGDGLGHLGARSLRDRHGRGLEGRHVVDPVSDHRDVPAPPSERFDDAPLPVGRDASDDGDVTDRPVELEVVQRHVVPVDRVTPERDADIVGDRRDRCGRVARQHHDLDPLPDEERDRLPRIRPKLLREHSEAECLERRQARVRVGQGTAPTSCRSPQRGVPRAGTPLQCPEGLRAGRARGRRERTAHHRAGAR